MWSDKIKQTSELHKVKRNVYNCMLYTLLQETFTPSHTNMQMFILTHTAYLGESSDPILIGEEWRVIADLEVKVNRLVCEGGELITEAELVGAILGCCEGKTVILLLHLLVECSSIWVLQTTVHIIMATGHHLGKHKDRRPIYSAT